jgi:SAM-dependent methyltransferase
MSAWLSFADGSAFALSVDRWLADVPPEDHRVLERAMPPVLDVGCGPGRHVLALAARGVPTLGIDSAPEAVRIAANRGAPVLLRSVFDAVPGERRWGTALLMDGNIGIGGDPTGLLTRLRNLLRRRGRALVEVEEPGHPMRSISARIESGDERSRAFPWAFVGADDIGEVGRATGFELVDLWAGEARWFACLDAA